MASRAGRHSARPGLAELVGRDVSVRRRVCGTKKNSVFRRYPRLAERATATRNHGLRSMIRPNSQSSGPDIPPFVSKQSKIRSLQQFFFALPRLNLENLLQFPVKRY